MTTVISFLTKPEDPKYTRRLTFWSRHSPLKAEPRPGNIAIVKLGLLCSFTEVNRTATVVPTKSDADKKASFEVAENVPEAQRKKLREIKARKTLSGSIAGRICDFLLGVSNKPASGLFLIVFP